MFLHKSGYLALKLWILLLHNVMQLRGIYRIEHCLIWSKIKFYSTRLQMTAFNQF